MELNKLSVTPLSSTWSILSQSCSSASVSVSGPSKWSRTNREVSETCRPSRGGAAATAPSGAAAGAVTQTNNMQVAGAQRPSGGAAQPWLCCYGAAARTCCCVCVSSSAFWCVLLWSRRDRLLRWVLIPPRIHDPLITSFFSFPEPLPLSRRRLNMFPSTRQQSIKAASIAFD